MAKLPRITGRDMVRFLEQQGYVVLRVRGAHHFMQGHGRRTSIPVHGNRNLKIGTLHAIIRDVGLSPSDFDRLWNR